MNGQHVHVPAPPRLTEPLLRAHLRDDHDWDAVRSYQHRYFAALVAHDREHRKARLTVAS